MGAATPTPVSIVDQFECLGVGGHFWRGEVARYGWWIVRSCSQCHVHDTVEAKTPAVVWYLLSYGTFVVDRLSRFVGGAVILGVSALIFLNLVRGDPTQTDDGFFATFRMLATLEWLPPWWGWALAATVPRLWLSMRGHRHRRPPKVRAYEAAFSRGGGR